MSTQQRIFGFLSQMFWISSRFLWISWRSLVITEDERPVEDFWISFYDASLLIFLGILVNARDKRPEEDFFISSIYIRSFVPFSIRTRFFRSHLPPRHAGASRAVTFTSAFFTFFLQCALIVHYLVQRKNARSYSSQKKSNYYYDFLSHLEDRGFSIFF